MDRLFFFVAHIPPERKVVLTPYHSPLFLLWTEVEFDLWIEDFRELDGGIVEDELLEDARWLEYSQLKASEPISGIHPIHSMEEEVELQREQSLTYFFGDPSRGPALLDASKSPSIPDSNSLFLSWIPSSSTTLLLLSQYFLLSDVISLDGMRWLQR